MTSAANDAGADVVQGAPDQRGSTAHGEGAIRGGVYENWHQWQRVEHGDGCLAHLAPELARLGVTRPFIVSTRSLLGTSLLAQVREACGVPIAGLFAESEPHTPREVVLRATRALREARPDGIVSFGGSTVVDTAKGAALAMAADVDQAADFDRLKQEATHPSDFGNVVLPHLALPTTLSGAEYSRDIGITNERLRMKEIFRFDAVSPQSIFLDPRLTGLTPHRLWAATGVKVMSDAIEQLYNKVSHPVVDAQCIAAIRAFSQALPLSLESEGEARWEARLRCQIASWQSLFAMHNAGTRVGIGSALRHQLGGMFRIPHGEATCVMLPHLLRYNFVAVPDRYRTLADVLGLGDIGADEVRLEAIVAAITRLIARLGLPTQLAPLGVDRRDLPLMAEHVMHEASLAYNPRTVEGPGEIVAILEAAL